MWKPEPTFCLLPQGDITALDTDVAILGASHGSPYRPGTPSHAAGGPSGLRGALEWYDTRREHVDMDRGAPLMAGVTAVDIGDVPTDPDDDGTVTVLADRWQGRRLNSPNDVVVKSDGSVWLTDPPLGILGNYEGHKADPEVPQAVYRIDGQTGEMTVVADKVLGPNGLCFSPDESILYVVESRGVSNRKILAYDVTTDGREIEAKWVLIDAGPGGTPDGMRCDVDGNLWCGWGMGTPELDGVMVFAPDGTPIGRIALPERCANVCFGGVKRNRLFMAAAQSLYALYVNTQGAPGG